MKTPVARAFAPEAKAQGKTYVLRLFVAEDEPNSMQAKKNLKRICRDHLKGDCEVEIIDVLEDFEAALKNNVLVTPALIVDAPSPSLTIVGNLSDTQNILSALRITGTQR